VGIPVVLKNSSRSREGCWYAHGIIPKRRAPRVTCLATTSTRQQFFVPFDRYLSVNLRYIFLVFTSLYKTLLTFIAI
jgi:hypothetical protein